MHRQEDQHPVPSTHPSPIRCHTLARCVERTQGQASWSNAKDAMGFIQPCIKSRAMCADWYHALRASTFTRTTAASEQHTRTPSTEQCTNFAHRLPLVSSYDSRNVLKDANNCTHGWAQVQLSDSTCAVENKKVLKFGRLLRLAAYEPDTIHHTQKRQLLTAEGTCS